jgi:hypothetical protein
MLFKNLIMAIVLALFYLKFFKGIAKVTKDLEKTNPTAALIFPLIYVIMVAFNGLVLNVLLTLLHITSFTFSDIFLCITASAFIETLGAEK